MAHLAPSLLSANFANLQEDIEVLNRSGVSYLHLDIMDGNYVPNISFGPGLIKAIRPLTTMTFDTHLMVEKPERYIDNFAQAGSDLISFHYEATTHQHRVIQNIKASGAKAGIALNPATSLDVLDYLYDDLDYILLMTVNPGFGGQKFIQSMCEKISELARIKEEGGYDFTIEVDGGIKIDNVQKIKDLGAELIVSGSGVFKADSIEDRIKEYKVILND